MKIIYEVFKVYKKFALTISRGTTSSTDNVWVRVVDDDVEGWGEASPFAIAQSGQTTDKILGSLADIIPVLEQYHPWERYSINSVLSSVPSSVRAAVDTALWDWMGKKLNVPIWKLLGLDSNRVLPTSLTVGISTPEMAIARVNAWKDVTSVRILKVKLGSPDGLECDRLLIRTIYEMIPDAILTVDANGGWSLKDAISMAEWLTQFKVEYIEQPLALGNEANLLELYQASPLPIFVDESCSSSLDIISLANCVDGINIKLMKCGGLSEALHMIHVAKAGGLKVMFGCYSDSSLANTAMVNLSSLADYLDLDSHLNLVNDPFIGTTLVDGCLSVTNLPGLGVVKNESIT